MNSESVGRAIRKLLLCIGFVATSAASAAEPVNLTDSTASGGAESGKRLPAARQVSQSNEPRWLSEPCSVSHEGRYRDGRYLKTRRYYDFDVRITSNCSYARMNCLVRYRTQVYEPAYFGSRRETASAPRWESSLQTLIVEPGQTKVTKPLGPARRNAGEYEIDCTRTSRH